MTTAPLPIPGFILSADWSKDRRKRCVHLVDVDARRITEVQRHDWDLGVLLTEARGLLGRREPVLIAMDLAIGVPAGLWRAVKADARWAQSKSFLDWLALVGAEPTFFDPVRDPTEWAVDRPFFRVQGGEGGLGRFTTLVEGGMFRKIDGATKAKPIFAASGIPGTVGSATACLWRELVPLLGEDRDFAVWPFEGVHQPIHLVESYPGLAYGAGVAETLPTARLAVDKTKPDPRNTYCDRLKAAPWLKEHAVELGDLARARENEDVFDSLVTAAALLRCILEERSLCANAWIDPEAEGTMVLAGPVDPSLRAKRLKVERAVGIGVELSPRAGDPVVHPCPIPGCDYVFRGSRGGWDPHVASLRIHPDWHPEITDGTKRKTKFREEFQEWLG